MIRSVLPARLIDPISGALSWRRTARVAPSRRDHEEAFPTWLGFVPIATTTAFALSLHYGNLLPGSTASAPTHVERPAGEWRSGGSIG